MVGFNSGNSLFDTAEETGGSADAITVSHTHTATVTDPGHTHGSNYVGSSNALGTPGGAAAVPTTLALIPTVTTGVTVAISTEGSSGTNANYQPYITVYMWKRTV
jgi:hypothetical protein